ncbi:MAG: hypothetical protein ACRC6C_02465 [Wolbachia pipientis]
MSVLSIKIGAILDGIFNTVIKGSSSQLTHLGENIITNLFILLYFNIKL